MRKFLFLVALLPFAASADMYIRNHGSNVGPAKDLTCGTGSGMVCARSGSTAAVSCDPADTTTKGCVSLTTQTFAGDKAFAGAVYFDAGVTMAAPLPVAQGGTGAATLSCAGSFITNDGGPYACGSTLAVANGGTGTASAPVDGGLVYGSARGYAFMAAASDAGQALLSGGTGAPTWGPGIWTQSLDMGFDAAGTTQSRMFAANISTENVCTVSGHLADMQRVTCYAVPVEADAGPCAGWDAGAYMAPCSGNVLLQFKSYAQEGSAVEAHDDAGYHVVIIHW